MKLKLLASLVAVLSAAAAFTLAPNANAADSERLETPQSVLVSPTEKGIVLGWRMIQADSTYTGDGVGYNVYRNGQYVTSTESTSYEEDVSSDAAHTYYVVAYKKNSETGKTSFSSKSQEVTANTSFKAPTMCRSAREPPIGLASNIRIGC